MQEQPNTQPLGRARRSALIFLLVAALLITLPASSQAAGASLLTNGSFEQGFTVMPACASSGKDAEGKVGSGWGCFTNGGAAHFGFHADSWAPVVADGQYSQLIEINTWGMLHGDNDRYAGIYQVVPVEPGALYRLSLRGMIRTTSQEGDPWRYRVQVGYIQGDQPAWKTVKNWIDAGWDKYYLRTEPGQFSSYQGDSSAGSDHLTVFVRVWRKWGITNEELDVNLDAIQLVKVEPPAS